MSARSRCASEADRHGSGPGWLYQLGALPATGRRAQITQAGHRGRGRNGVNTDKSNFAAVAALLLAACALSAGSVRAASGANKTFTVGNYPVEAQAKNAVAAKEKAHAEGQQAAFRSLLKRIVPVTAYNRMDRLKTANAGDFIDGVAVRSERNSSTEYIAALDFSFQADSVRNLLRREGVPFIDEQAPKSILIPIMRETSGAPDGVQPASASGEFRAASAPWSEAWKGLDLDNTLTPLKIEPLLPAVPAGVIQTLLSGGSGAMNDLADQYKSDNILFAVAEIDTSMKRLHVTLAGDDAVGPLLWRRDYRLTDNDVSYAMELAAVVTLGVLEGRWKAAKSEAFGGVEAFTGPGTEVLLEVEFSSLAEWNELRRRVVDTPGVDDVQIGAVSARSAEVTLRYPGGGQPLSNTLARQGLSLRSEGERWHLRASF